MWEALGDYHGPPNVRTFSRYASARLNREVVDRSYRMYVTDSLRSIPQLSYVSKRWSDIMYGTGSEEIDAEEIVDGVISRLEE